VTPISSSEIVDTMRILSSPVLFSLFPLIASNLLFDLLIKAGSEEDHEEGERYVSGETELSCSCSTLLLSSLGQAAGVQPQSMGIYKRWDGQEYSQRPVYRGPASSVLYFSEQPTYSCWMIGPHLGSLSGYIYNPSLDFPCPYFLPHGWKFFSGADEEWFIDPSLVLRCIPANANNGTKEEEEGPLAFVVLT